MLSQNEQDRADRAMEAYLASRERPSEEGS
jgi:hypothetical protein